MSDLIKRTDAIKAILSKPAWHGSDGSYYYSSDIKDAINNLPTFDERPKGKWTDRNGRIVYPELERYRCSVCGQDSDRYNYCPNCGADMRGETT